MNRIGFLFFLTLGLGVTAQTISLFRDTQLYSELNHMPPAESRPRSTLAKHTVSFQHFVESPSKPNEQEFMKTVVASIDVNERLILPNEMIDVLRQMAESTSIPREFLPHYGDYTTPLAVALQNDFVDAANLLLEKGADPNVDICCMVTSPLHQAIILQNYGMVSNLLAHGANPNHIEANGSAVSMAVKSWKSKSNALSSEMRKGMVSKEGSFVRSKAEELVSNLNENQNLSAIGDSLSLSILKLLVESGASVTNKNYLGLEPLVSAVVANNIDAFKYLLSVHPSPENCIVSIKGTPIPLHFLLASKGESFLPYLSAMHSAGIDLFRPFKGETISSWAEGFATKRWLESIQEK